MSAREPDDEVSVRIILIDPPVGVRFALQRGKGELVAPVTSDGSPLSFELSLRVGARQGQEGPNFLGPFAQGPRGGRFVYINSGTSASQYDSRWSRRAKIGLQEITWPLIERHRASPGSILEARITGTSKDGGPVCASVPLEGDGWKVVQSRVPSRTRGSKG
jgi:hypothetical protein